MIGVSLKRCNVLRQLKNVSLTLPRDLSYSSTNQGATPEVCLSGNLGLLSRRRDIICGHCRDYHIYIGVVEHTP
jgi:hypothetical protein